MTDAEKLLDVARFMSGLPLEALSATGKHQAISSLRSIATKLDRLHDREWVGRMMHEAWSETKQRQGFHHPREIVPLGKWYCSYCMEIVPNECITNDERHDPRQNGCGLYLTKEHNCDKCHDDLVAWDDLPEPQKDINRHALDRVLEALEQP